VLVVVGFTITGAYFFGKALVETKLRDELALRGFSDIAFNVSSIGLKGISFSDISLGDKLPFKLGSITLDYSIVELLRGNLRDLHLDSIHITKDDMRVEIKNVQAHFEGARHGSWSVESIDIHNAPVPIPPLAGAGTFDMQKDPLRVKGAFQSANNSHRANFSLQYDSDHPDTSKLTIETAAFPWNGGVVSTQNAVIPLGANKAAELTLKLTNIPMLFRAIMSRWLYCVRCLATFITRRYRLVSIATKMTNYPCCCNFPVTTLMRIMAGK